MRVARFLAILVAGLGGGYLVAVILAAAVVALDGEPAHAQPAELPPLLCEDLRAMRDSSLTRSKEFNTGYRQAEALRAIAIQAAMYADGCTAAYSRVPR